MRPLFRSKVGMDMDMDMAGDIAGDVAITMVGIGVTTTAGGITTDAD